MTNYDRRSLLRMAGVSAGALALGAGGGYMGALAAEAPPAPVFTDVPDIIVNPIEVSGPDAAPVMGRLPGARKMYMLPSGVGEYHRVGGFALTRLARPIETGGVYEMLNFTGRTGATMPRHLHRMSHVAMVVMGGDIDFELDGKKWRMMHGDFANIPPGTPHGWTMRSDRSSITLFAVGDRVGAAFTAMGTPSATAVPLVGLEPTVPADKVAAAAFAGDFMRIEQQVAGEAVRVTNLMLPQTPTPYVLLDGGGERYGNNTFCTKNQNTLGQFLIIMSEGGGDGDMVPPHFHARHTENFYGLDGETLGWANGKAVPLHAGDLLQTPPLNVHGFKLTQKYNRFVGFLTPGIFEVAFTRGVPGENGVGGHVTTGWRGQAKAVQQATGATGNDRYRIRMMSGKGPDGYPLDVHGPTQPMPPQDPVWLGDAKTGLLERRKLLTEHAMAICGSDEMSREISPSLARALKFKPKATDFI